MNKLKEKALMMFVGLIIEKMTPEMLKSWMDMGLDLVVNSVEKTENKIDDAIVLPVCKIVREAFEIEDND